MATAEVDRDQIPLIEKELHYRESQAIAHEREAAENRALAAGLRLLLIELRKEGDGDDQSK